jgi:hypothetical protein
LVAIVECKHHPSEGDITVDRERALKILLALVGLFFVAGIYPLITSMMHPKQSDYPDQMILAVYVTLGHAWSLPVVSHSQPGSESHFDRLHSMVESGSRCCYGSTVAPNRK